MLAILQPAPVHAEAAADFSGAADSATQEEGRRQERERALRQREEKIPHVRLPRNNPLSEKAAATAAAVGAAANGNNSIFPEESPCFPIAHIVLRGANATYFNSALRRVTEGLDAATGRCLGTAGINIALMRVQDAIVADGFVTTRILAGPQDLRSGTLIMTVLPGRVHAVRLVGEAGTATAAGCNRGNPWTAMPMRNGELLNLRDIEQGLENFKRVPTAEADIQIEPAVFDMDGEAVGTQAEQAGQSDLVIRYRQATPFRLNLSMDDGGSSGTGKYQGGATLSYDNWWTLNDLFYFSLSGDLGGGDSERYGTRGYNVHYSAPFGYWALGVNASANRYHQTVALANQNATYSGNSETKEIKLSRVLYRDAFRKTGLSLRGMLRSSRNFIRDVEVGVQRRQTAAWELALTHREFIGNASLDAGLAYRRGTGAFDAMRAPEERTGEGTSRFKLITADLNLRVPMRFDMPWGKQIMRYTLSARGQWNDTRLTPQDRFSVGGRYTVRGFDGEMVLMAESGWLLRNEIGMALGTGQEGYLGLDYGVIGGPSAAKMLGRHLAGAAMGLRGGFMALPGFSYDIFAATPLSKPDNFKTATLAAGFNLNWSY